MNGLLVEYQTKANILVNATVLETEKKCPWFKTLLI